MEGNPHVTDLLNQIISVHRKERGKLSLILLALNFFLAGDIKITDARVIFIGLSFLVYSLISAFQFDHFDTHSVSGNRMESSVLILGILWEI